MHNPLSIFQLIKKIDNQKSIKEDNFPKRILGNLNNKTKLRNRKNYFELSEALGYRVPNGIKAVIKRSLY